MAPEMVLNRGYDAKVDLWSVGVILFECLFGKAPYKSETLEELMQKITSEQPIIIPKGAKISQSCRDLLKRCLERNPSKRIEYEEFFSHEFLDLEHIPGEESHSKTVTLIDEAVRLDNEGLIEEALTLYKSALEYLIPLILSERNPSTKLSLRKKADQYIKRAEAIKQELGLSSSTSSTGNYDFSTHSSNTTAELLFTRTMKTEEVLKLSQNTPSLRSALEIAQSAELYDLEGQTEIAFNKYQSALGLLLPLLAKEPKGDRKSLLSREIQRWMSRAETIKDYKAIEDKAVGESVDKNCVIQ